MKLNDSEYGFITTVPFKSVTQKFIPNEEIVNKVMDGRTVKNIFEIKDNVLIEHQIEENRKLILIREFHEDKMKGEAKFNEMKTFFCSLPCDSHEGEK